MTETDWEFEPIIAQTEFDERIQARLAREREKLTVHKIPDAVAALDRLLWERWRGKVRRGGAESLFALVLTAYSENSEISTEGENNVGTNKCL